MNAKALIEGELIGENRGNKVLTILIDTSVSSRRISTISGIVCRQVSALRVIDIVNTTLESIT